MAKHLDIPNFASEAEEADWWPQQEDALFEAFQKEDAAGDLGCGTAASTVGLFPVLVEDAVLANEQAARKEDCRRAPSIPASPSDPRGRAE